MTLLERVFGSLLVLRSPKRIDERGSFQEVYKRSDLRRWGIESEFVQDNVSFSKAGALRGLHFQKAPFEQGKLISVWKGKTFTVAVDLRPGSPTYGNHRSFDLCEDDDLILYVPTGFAHGFLAISDCIYAYKTTCEYEPDAEAGIRWDDPTLAIRWPLLPKIISSKDQKLPNWNTFKT